MLLKNKLISIIVPCYNQAEYISETLQSVLNQTYQNWECIIVNDGSPDNLEDIALSWCKKDSRFQYLKKQNAGLSSARNAGIKIARGEWILPLDADDLISKNYLELASFKFDQQNIKIIYCKAEKFGKENGLWELQDFSLSGLAIGNHIFCTAFFRKQDWENVGGYDENLKKGLEDWDFWICILKKGGDVYRINSVCFFYRTKEVSMITLMDQKTYTETYKYLENKHLDFFISNMGTLHDMYHKIELCKMHKEQYEQAYKKIIKSKKYKFINFITNPFSREKNHQKS